MNEKEDKELNPSIFSSSKDLINGLEASQNLFKRLKFDKFIQKNLLKLENTMNSQGFNLNGIEE